MRWLIFSLVLLASGFLSAQVLTSEVISSGGETFKDNTGSIEWTLGELMTETFGASLTQGFHQPSADVTAPVARCRETVVAQINAAGMLDLRPEDLDDGSFDTETPAELLRFRFANPAGLPDCADVDGPARPVELVVTDQNGFFSSCTSLVSVIDTLPPTVVCRDTTLVLDPVTGTTSLLFLLEAETYGAGDNCADLIIRPRVRVGDLTMDCSDLRSGLALRRIPVQIEDASGNATACLLTILVTDPNGVCAGTPPGGGGGGGFPYPGFGFTPTSGDDVTLYPNPVTEVVNLQLPKGASVQGLTDTKGGVVPVTFSGGDGRLTADVSGLVAGVYFLRVRMSEGRTETKRLIVR
ncbi:MAG: T9SS type A sorting domain-containing protein [Bacteroidota bacterium]